MVGSENLRLDGGVVVGGPPFLQEDTKKPRRGKGKTGEIEAKNSQSDVETTIVRYFILQINMACVKVLHDGRRLRIYLRICQRVSPVPLT
jgi:hypothetical protein